MDIFLSRCSSMQLKITGAYIATPNNPHGGLFSCNSTPRHVPVIQRLQAKDSTALPRKRANISDIIACQSAFLTLHPHHIQRDGNNMVDPPKLPRGRLKVPECTVKIIVLGYAWF